MSSRFGHVVFWYPAHGQVGHVARQAGHEEQEVGRRRHQRRVGRHYWQTPIKLTPTRNVSCGFFKTWACLPVETLANSASRGLCVTLTALAARAPSDAAVQDRAMRGHLIHQPSMSAVHVLSACTNQIYLYSAATYSTRALGQTTENSFCRPSEQTHSRQSEHRLPTTA